MKDSPLEGASRAGSRTVWLDAANSQEARENYWSAYLELLRSAEPAPQEVADKQIWNIAWAAAIAADSYINEGRIAPR